MKRKLVGLQSESIFEQCTRTFDNIIGDFAGGSPVPKTFLMSFLTQDQNLTRYLELGVYRGKSLFPVAYGVHLNGGKTIGVDAYDAKTALENDVPRETKIKIKEFFQELDIEGVYRDLLAYKQQCGFGQTIEIIRKTSDSFFSSLPQEEFGPFDLIHIDANHDTVYVKKDYENSLRCIKNGGFFVFDDIDWPSVDVVYQEAKRNHAVVFECENFGILLHEESSIKRDLKVEQISKKLNSVYKQASRLVKQDSDYIPSISVGVLTYNQVDSIEECLTSIVDQQGNFSMRIIVADDCSNDGTYELIQDFISNQNSNEITFEVIRNEFNVGVMNNLETLIDHCKGSDYTSLIEGDDLFFSSRRLSNHLDFHKMYPDLSMSFNGFLLLDETASDEGYRVWDGPASQGTIPTNELVLTNHVGNLGAMFFNSQVLHNLDILCPKMFANDWILSIVCSQYGSVRKLNVPLSVYRKNKNGYRVSMSQEEKKDIVLGNFDLLNKHQDFAFDEEISRSISLIQGDTHNQPEPASLLVIDDVFPHPASGFRFEEFSEILNRISGSELITTGESCHLLGKDSVNELLIDFKRRNEHLANKVRQKTGQVNTLAKLLYCDFLGNAYFNVLPVAESSNTPFLFTLYPGGMFALNNTNSDKLLSRVMNSPQFRKVIVTQDITRDYLLRKNFCPSEKIELIWGVVVPHRNLLASVDKKRYGFEKQALDLCFVAHQYTRSGSDKGIDTFLLMAKIISKKFDNVNFHIVGPWNRENHDVEGIKNIYFYGVLSQEQLSKFYEDKDAIVSPNKPDQIIEGSFDGFPSAAAIDASLRKLAMIVSDPLSLNGDRFINGKEIIITSNNPMALATNIEFFLQNPTTLSSIADKGYKKSNHLYSAERQLTRRVKLIESALL